jgi:hypothetical protein
MEERPLHELDIDAKQCSSQKVLSKRTSKERPKQKACNSERENKEKYEHVDVYVYFKGYNRL